MKKHFFRKMKKSESGDFSSGETLSTKISSEPKGAFFARLTSNFGPLLISFSHWFQVKAQPVLRKVDWKLIRTAAIILALSFVLANSVSTTAANIALESVANLRKSSSKTDDATITNVNASSMISKSGPSPSELRKAIVERNLFNLEGKVPPEPESSTGGPVKDKNLKFDSVACSTGTLPVEITGHIFTGTAAESVILLKDSKIEDSDVYRAGDVIIGHEDFEIYRIGRNNVEIRKGDSKICIEIGSNKKAPSTSSGTGEKVTAFAVNPNVPAIELTSEYIQKEIGPGYANILNSAKLIPEATGFKLIAINPGTLFEKIGLKNGDIVADVNGVSLRDATQGFKLYQSLQEEREIVIGVMRGGQPTTVKVRVK